MSARQRKAWQQLGSKSVEALFKMFKIHFQRLQRDTGFPFTKQDDIDDRKHLEYEHKYRVGKYTFQASAANGIGNKLDCLTEMEHVLQFIIAPPPQVDTIIYLNYGSCFTYTSIYVISMQLSSCHVLFSLLVYTTLGVNVVANKTSQS